MHIRELVLIGGVGGFLAWSGSAPVTVRVNAPHAGLVARISGPAFKILDRKPLRAGAGFVMVETPAEIEIDPSRGEHYFRLDPDTAWISVEVHTSRNTISATARNLVVRSEGNRIEVVGVPAPTNR